MNNVLTRLADFTGLVAQIVPEYDPSKYVAAPEQSTDNSLMIAVAAAAAVLLVVGGFLLLKIKRHRRVTRRHIGR